LHMITTEDINYLYSWAKDISFPFKKAPTAEGYSNKPIYFCWLKGSRSFKGVRASIVQDNKAYQILDDPDVLFATVASFDPGTELGPHRDPNVYSEPYSRIQIPLEIPDNRCYMVWKGEKVFWEIGQHQKFNVMDVIHEGYNYSDDKMTFIFLDVKRDGNTISKDKMHGM